MTLPVNFELDHKLVRKHFAASAATADTHDFLAREVSRRMSERLEYIRIEPQRILDLGCGTAHDAELFARRYPVAQRVCVDAALPLLEVARRRSSALQRIAARFSGKHSTQLLCADANHLPLQRASVQMLWSNLMLHWLHDPLPAMREMHRVLAIDGLLMFSTLGPDTLNELRACLPTSQGERVHRFIDMHDLGDCLVQAGFAEPVMDMERITLTYADLDTLLDEIVDAGAGNASTARPRALSGRTGWKSAREAYERLRVEGRLPATFEIVYGHAWKAAPKTLDDGRAVIQFRQRP